MKKLFMSYSILILPWTNMDNGRSVFFRHCHILLFCSTSRGRKSGPEIYVSLPRNLASLQTRMSPFGLQMALNVKFGNAWPRLAKSFETEPPFSYFSRPETLLDCCYSGLRYSVQVCNDFIMTPHALAIQDLSRPR